MHSLEILLTVWGVYFLALVTPGPNFVVIARMSVSAGQKAASWTALGVSTGTLLYSSTGMFGLIGVLRLASWLAPVVQIAGGVYLGYIGIRLIFTKSRPGAGDEGSEEIGRLEAYRAGLLNTLANPKTIGFFVSLFAVLYHTPLGVWMRAALLAGILVLSVGYNSLLAASFSHPSMRALYVKQRRRLDMAIGGVMLAFGWRLASQGRSAILRM